MKELFKRSWLSATNFFIATLITAVPLSAQETHSVSISGFAFAPSEITITAGDEVTWTGNNESHNVNGTQATFPSNPESFGNDIGTNWSYSYVFNETGEYDYRCDAHFASGMTGKVIVEGAMNTLTISFKEMTPHVGQLFKLYVKDIESGSIRDSVVIEELEGPEFEVQSSAIQTGGSYHIDFFADFNENGMYDAPPDDHAWQIALEDVEGDTSIEFVHNLNFTDIGTPGSTYTFSEKSLAGLHVYPNPSGGIINLRSDTNIQEIRIYSIHGKLVRAWNELTGTGFTLPVENLAEGTYMLKAISVGGMESYVIIIMQ